MGEENVKWYILHTYSGYENMVKDNLELVFKKNDCIDRLREIVIPMEDVVEEKANGKRKIVQRRLMPTYVFIKMDYDNSMWHMITNTRGVTGFVDFHVGETVRIIDSSLEGFVGTIDAVDPVNSKCKVTVSMFGRLTPVELELYQIERLDDASSAE